MPAGAACPDNSLRETPSLLKMSGLILHRPTQGTMAEGKDWSEKSFSDMKEILSCH